MFDYVPYILYTHNIEYNRLFNAKSILLEEQ